MKYVTYASLMCLPTPCMLIDFPPKISAMQSLPVSKYPKMRFHQLRTPLLSILPGLGTPNDTMKGEAPIALRFSLA